MGPRQPHKLPCAVAHRDEGASGFSKPVERAHAAQAQREVARRRNQTCHAQQQLQGMQVRCVRKAALVVAHHAGIWIRKRSQGRQLHRPDACLGESKPLRACVTG